MSLFKERTTRGPLYPRGQGNQFIGTTASKRCFVKVTVTGSDVTVTNDSDGCVHLKYTLTVSGKCQCEDCKTTSLKDMWKKGVIPGTPQQDPSQIPGGPPCESVPNSTSDVWGGGGGFYFEFCKEVDYPCPPCTGGWGPITVEKEWAPGKEGGDSCNDRPGCFIEWPWISKAIQDNLIRQFDALPSQSPLLDCGSTTAYRIPRDILSS